MKFQIFSHPGSLLDVLSWIEQATYHVRIGFKNQPPLVGSHIYLAPLINSTWLQSIESKGGIHGGDNDPDKNRSGDSESRALKAHSTAQVCSQEGGQSFRSSAEAGEEYGNL